MEWIVFWAIINAIVGAVIGERKKMVGGAIALSIFLGPIGWVIALFSEGTPRRCFFCTEAVKDEAKICPHCQRELPRMGKPPPRKPINPKALVALGAAAVLIVALLIGIPALRDARERAEIRRQQDAATEWYRSTHPNESPTPSIRDNPYFVVLTDDFSAYAADGSEKQIPFRTRLQVVRRYEHDVVVSYNGKNYVVPSAITEPAK